MVYGSESRVIVKRQRQIDQRVCRQALVKEEEKSDQKHSGKDGIVAVNARADGTPYVNGSIKFSKLALADCRCLFMYRPASSESPSVMAARIN